MKSDTQIRYDIEAELAWDPAVGTTQVGVAVREGIVTLSGTLDTYAQKHAVERAVRRVAGVRGMAMDLEVRLSPGHRRTDAEIAQAAAHALRWHSMVPDGHVQVEVEDGWVTLRGQVDFAFQAAGAEQSLRPLVGVTGITNAITIKPRAGAGDLAEGIRAALTRHAEREARHLQVDVDGGVVTLSGRVGSIAEHDAAVGTAYAARGVARVVDLIEIAP